MWPLVEAAVCVLGLEPAPRLTSARWLLGGRHPGIAAELACGVVVVGLAAGVAFRDVVGDQRS